MSSFSQFAAVIALLWGAPVIILAFAYLKARRHHAAFEMEEHPVADMAWRPEPARLAYSQSPVLQHDVTVPGFSTHEAGRLSSLIDVQRLSRYPAGTNQVAADIALPIYDRAGRPMTSTLRVFLN